MKSYCQLLALVLGGFAQAQAQTAERPPNIVYIMSDELAYYELSHMGNPRIRTPRIDRMAAEGIRFTQALAGSPVCAPLRCTLMTGRHAGHASVRANDGGTPLRADEPTIASMLKAIGYATGGFGKWGCGGRDSTGVPEKHGFDVFFGYYDQVHAHSFYPPYLIRNSEEVKLAGNRGGRHGQSYSHYAIMDEAMKFIRANKDRPFFCYLPITPPHGMYDIPADDPAWKHYRDDQWIKDPKVPQDAKNYAAMVTMVDRNVGQVLDLLKELKLEDDTIVFFTGDNGGQDRFRSKRHPRGYFGPNVHPTTGVEFRGGKGNLYEGGLRIPFIVRWPEKIRPGRVSNLLFYQPDVLPTLAELTGAKAPAEIDGLSILPELIGTEAAGSKQQKHEFLYWEYGAQVAVRMGKWKAIRPKKGAPWALYDLDKDISETTNVADRHPDVLARMKAFAKQSHLPVRPGTYQDRARHERDRRAKWGSTRAKAGNYPRRVKRIQARNPIPAAKQRQRPNIVLLFADDLGWTDLGCFGSTFYETPNLDRLAKQGMRFTNAYTNGPNCAPTRACMISGQYGPRHGIFTVGDPWRGSKSRRKLIPVPNNTTLPLEKITVAEGLKAGGYVTGAFGKWHLGGGEHAPDAKNHSPTNQGFDVYIGKASAGSPPRGYFLPENTKLPGAKPGEYLTDYLTNRGLEFIEANRDRPFFLYQSYHSVHTPIQSKNQYQARYRKKPVPAGSKHRNPAYAGMVQSLDENCGRILDKLEELGIAENTVVFFMSDNGGVGGYRDAGIGGKEITSNAPLRGGKGMLYEGGVRVPMIVRWPGVVRPGSTCRAPVITIDFYPTFLAIADVPGDPKHLLDGRSLAPLLKQTGKLDRDAIYWHFPAYLQGYGGNDRTTPAGAIRSGDFKLLEFFEDGRLELYNLAEDIGQKNNLAEKTPDKTRELHRKLLAWRKSVKAPMPRPNPDYNPRGRKRKKSRRGP